MSTPKGGGAIRGLGEKLSMNPATGTASFEVPVATTPGRAGFELDLSLSYDSGSGNGPFGLGWSLSIPAISRRTEKGLPHYDDNDVFLLSGASELVRVSERVDNDGRRIVRYRPRTEGLFARIERIEATAGDDVHWRVVTKDNVTQLYGRNTSARIADPADPSRIFSWLLEETVDDRGNVARYTYAAENGQNVEPSLVEESRFDLADPAVFVATAQRYVKRIEYGNRVPFVHGDGCFEVVFDYGEHDLEYPRVDDDVRVAWPAREDRFSSFKPGFEVRTYRRCVRVLVFHHFRELDSSSTGGIAEPTLVRSTDLGYAPSAAMTYLRSITQCGYVRSGAGYRKATLPPVELDYQPWELHDESVALVGDGAHALENGFDGAAMQWQDLHGEGIPGLLIAGPRSWHYARNEGGGSLAAPRLQRSLPAPAELGGGAQQLSDVDADGRLELVSFNEPLAGWFSVSSDATSSSFHSFHQLPKIDWSDSNLRFLDLDGDGLGDVLITEQDVFCWYRSLGKNGFEGPRWASKPKDERIGPTALFSDGTETIHLVDMSGDGLTDIVRVRNGEVCYWPNLGFGRFGRRITMESSPTFDSADRFDPSRLRFADVDGSGTTDVLYLDGRGVLVFLNQSGNCFTGPQRLSSLPGLVATDRVTTMDLLGNGTTCLVWSTSVPGGRASIRYVDLMGGKKPHLLRQTENNLGSRTSIQYASSTTFYNADRTRGVRWLTRLPFPVQVVARIVEEDLVARSTLTKTFAYRHGYFDGEDREFGGFARVDEWDEEAFHEEPLPLTSSAATATPTGSTSAPALRRPPIRTTSWFHTGAWLEQTTLEQALKLEYGPRSSNGELDPLAPLLADTPSNPEWSVRDEKEATRALRGQPLRQEVFSEDGTAAAPLPFAVTESSHRVKRLRPSGTKEHDYGVFLVVPDQTFSAHYERGLTDARIEHDLVLDTDDFGNVLDAASVAYGRVAGSIADHPSVPTSARARLAQQRTLVTRAVSRFTTPIDDDVLGMRGPLPCETRTYELTGLKPAGTYFVPNELRDATTHLRDYATDVDLSRSERRKVEHVRILYRSDDLARVLPLGETGVLGLAFEEYQLALTADVLARNFVRTNADASTEDLVSDRATLLGASGGYVARAMLAGSGAFPADPGPGDEDNEDYWAPAGQTYLSPGAAHDAPDLPADELVFAKRHFFLPWRHRDPFGSWTRLQYDAHLLLPIESIDSLENRITLGERFADGRIVWKLDYRVLQATTVSDPNRNRTAYVFDALGMVVGTAMMGKPDGPVADGDSFAEFSTDLDEATLVAHLEGNDPRATATTLLGSATSRFVYDAHAFVRAKRAGRTAPLVVHSLQRETHTADLAESETSKIHLGFTYFDGMSREVQHKLPAEPGPLVPGGPVVNPRWVGSGWVLLNNKGKPVRKYEPFFSASHHFEDARQEGVSSILLYDSAERVVAILHPNHTFEKTVFSPWEQTVWDANDTVSLDPTADPDLGADIRLLPTSEVLPTWREQRVLGQLGEEERDAAEKASAHAGTPTVVHVDPRGRALLTVAHNRYSTAPPNPVVVDELRGTHRELDIEGLERAVWDALGREVVRYDYDLRGRCVRTRSMDAGTRWTLGNVVDQSIAAWDDRGHTFRIAYDVLKRPIRSTVAGQANQPAEIVFATTEYGEGHPDAETLNLRGRLLRLRDTAGEVSFVSRAPGAARDEAYDTKGNAIFSVRRLAREYKRIPDWRTDALEAEAFQTETRMDALNRPRRIVTPDQSVTLPIFNEANLLERVEVQVRGGARRTFVEGVDYDAKGRRLSVTYGNDVVTSWDYDPLTFRVRGIQTRRPSSAWPDDQSDPGDEKKRPVGLQYLTLTHDPVGNVTSIVDDAMPTIFYAGNVTSGRATYEYDASYQLRAATGREHVGQASAPHTTADDEGRSRLPHPHDAAAMRPYTQRYDYDAVGNLREVEHSTAATRLWTRAYEYTHASGLDSSAFNNALSRTQVRSNSGQVYEDYRYPLDAHGNITAITNGHLTSLDWDAFDRLLSTSRQRVTAGTAETTYYVYDSRGERVRKITDGYAPAGATPQKTKERIYLGGSEIYREYGVSTSSTDGPTLERETLHVHALDERVAIVETRTKGNDGSPTELVRYQLTNHLRSVTIELDEHARIITHEEFHPFGSCAFQGVRNSVEAPKRYRFTGKERDDESGLAYHGARYYAPWLGRWTSPDPAGLADGINVFVYSRNAPIGRTDANGMESKTAHKEWSLGATPSDKLDKNSSAADRAAFVRRRGYVLHDPDPTNDRWDGKSWDLGPDAWTEPIGSSKGPAAGAGESSGSGSKASPPPKEEGFFESIVSGKSEPGFGKSLIPVLGSIQSANYHFAHENWIRGTIYTALAVSDVFLVRPLVVGGIKTLRTGVMSLKGLGTVVAKELSELVGTKAGGWGSRMSLGTKLQRIFWKGGKSYDRMQSIVNRVLDKTFRSIENGARSTSLFEMHHWLIQKKWFEGVHAVANPRLRAFLQKVGNAGWNLVPLPRPINNMIGKSMTETAAFAAKIAQKFSEQVDYAVTNIRALASD